MEKRINFFKTNGIWHYKKTGSRCGKEHSILLNGLSQNKKEISVEYSFEEIPGETLRLVLSGAAYAIRDSNKLIFIGLYTSIGKIFGDIPKVIYLNFKTIK